MVTAYGDDERRRKASEYGAADFVTKPVGFDNLKRQLQQLSPPLAEAEAQRRRRCTAACVGCPLVALGGRYQQLKGCLLSEQSGYDADITPTSAFDSKRISL
jgi:FixJ family two-component response regulator